MTAWCVSWKDSNGHHDIGYSSLNAVMDHVEYSLEHGFKIRGVNVKDSLADMENAFEKLGKAFEPMKQLTEKRN